MQNLQLVAKTKEQEKIKAYLEENASDVLAEKINKGIQIEKDGYHLLTKKTLDGFMKYATEEARKQAEKGANCACVDDEVVYGWAIHYFEEDSIEGELFNRDGTPYKPNPTVKTVEPKPSPKAVKEKSIQFSLFDEPEEEQDEEEDESEDEIEEPIVEKEPTISDFYQQYLDIKSKYQDALLFIRLGDFYEAYGKDAEVMSEIVDLTLTSRNVGLEERIPMCGAPYHCVDLYIRKIIDKDYKVALCENMQQPKIYEPDIQSVNENVDVETGEIYGNDDLIVILNKLFGGSYQWMKK